MTDSADMLLSCLDGSGSDREWQAAVSLRERVGERLPSLLLDAYRNARRSGPRSSFVYHATRYARCSADAVTLGLEALHDKARTVRYRACGLLAYSQRIELMPELQACLKSIESDSEPDIRAAIDSLQHRNQNYFLDRGHSGKMLWNVDGDNA